MRCSLQIATRDVELSSAIATLITERAHRLCRVNDKIVSLRVVIESPRYHRRLGLVYSLTLEICIPGGDLVVQRELYGDLSMAVRLAFDTARRLLRDHTRRRRDGGKRRAPDSRQRVAVAGPHAGAHP